ncbi:MAG: RNA polymerase sigma factor [Ignavibacteriota bacterium]
MALSDNELIINAQNGDVLAFEELMYRYDKMVLRIALKYTGNSDDSKDIYQDVFIKVFKGLSNFQFKSEFSTWLFRIATNTCITFKRKYNMTKHFSLNDDEDSNFLSSIPDDESLPDKLVANSEQGEKIDAALNNLSPNQKMSFLLKHYEGYKIREIAEMMNCKEGTIKKYLFEAVRKLKLQLENTY